MSLRVLAIAAAIGAAALPAASQAAQPAAAAAAADPVGAHAAIAQAEERLAEMDATITVLQTDADSADAAVRQRAHDAVESLRTIRETYRKEIDGVVAKGREMTADQIAVAKAALEAPWVQFDRAVDGDVAAIKLSVDQRKALITARLEAEQAYWQKVISDLQASAKDLTAEQRAAIDARIARVKARAEEAQARAAKLSHATQSAWAALKKGFVNSRQVFDDTYGR